MNDPFDDIVQRVRQAEKLLMVTHARPDGDALGSAAALAGAAEDAGKSASVLVPDSVPQQYQFLFAGRNVAGAKDFASLADQADLVVILDTCAASQLDGLVEHIGARRGKVVVMDHHSVTEDIGEVQWIDTSAAAAGIMVGRVIDALGWDVSARTAEALMTALTTDTGWLRFANTDAEALRAVARCVEAGIRPDLLYRKLYQCERPEKIRLMTRVLDSMELHCGGNLAAMTIRQADFQSTGARPDETENLVNEALRLATVETAIIVIENADCVRASLRSRDAIDVAEIARLLGGGGHRRAAGLRSQDDVDVVKRRLIAACAEALAAAGIGGQAEGNNS